MTPAELLTLRLSLFSLLYFALSLAVLVGPWLICGLWNRRR